MQINELKPGKVLIKAFLKVKSNRTNIERFKTNLILLLDATNEKESEELHKNLVSDFLKKTYYDPAYFINTKGRNDLVIHNDNNASSTVGVILETKSLGKTNIYEWFIFDAVLFDRIFEQNKNLVKQFNDFENGRLADIITG